MIKTHGLLTSLLLAVILTGCGAPADLKRPAWAESETLSVTDGLNRSISLEIPAQRIVSLAPSNTELLFDVGAGAQVIGRDAFSNYPQQALGIQEIGGSMGQYDYEAIAVLQPDLVLAAGINTPEQVRSLENLGLNVYYLANPTDFPELFHNIYMVSLLSGHTVEGEALVSDLSRRVAEIQTQLAAVSNRPTVYYELDATDPALPYTIGEGTFGDYMIKMAGGINIGAAIGQGWVQISSEEILLSDPYLILLGDAYVGITPETVAARPGWDALDAVRNNRVIPFDDDLMSRPTARLVNGLEALVVILHPEFFGN